MEKSLRNNINENRAYTFTDENLKAIFKNKKYSDFYKFVIDGNDDNWVLENLKDGDEEYMYNRLRFLANPKIIKSIQQREVKQGIVVVIKTYEPTGINEFYAKLDYDYK